MRSTPPRRPRHPASTTRTSYHVGRPWMLDGKMFRAATGTPIFRTERAKRPFADAEPEPLTLANLTTKSLMRRRGLTMVLVRGQRGGPRHRLFRARDLAGVRHRQQELLHVPCARGTAFGAEAAMEAHVFVLRHDAAGGKRQRHVKVLRQIERRRQEPG